MSSLRSHARLLTRVDVNDLKHKAYMLIGPDGRPYPSPVPGELGGHRRNKIYGRLDCPVAERWIAAGSPMRHRVFFADEAAAVAAGYRPCARCKPERYRAWKEGR